MLDWSLNHMPVGVPIVEDIKEEIVQEIAC